LTILDLETKLSGIAKGLTRTPEGLSVLEDESDLGVQAEAERIRLARDDPRATKLREAIFAAIRGVVELWSVDAGVGNVRPCLSRAYERRTDNVRYMIGIERLSQINYLSSP
jgi:hypothetical protein